MNTYAEVNSQTVSAEQNFETRLDSLRVAYHIPGMSFAILRRDSILYTGGLGYADIESEVPATPTTNYRIASLTKPIAATLLLQLEQAGRLSIRDSIKSLVPGYEDYYRQVRKYVLANEPEYAFLVENFEFERDELTVWHHLTHTAEYTPGDTFHYNGFLYGGLSRVMELQVQAPFSEIIQDSILGPLGMHTSAPSQEVSSQEVLQKLAKPYRYDAQTQRFQPSDYPSPDVNAGAGIVSNAIDLAKFDAAIRNHTLIKEETQNKAWTNQVNNADEKIPYGLGWFVQEYDGQPVVWHYGWQPGSFSGLYLKFPEDDLTFILLANGENLSAPFVEKGYKRDVFASPFAQLFLETFLDR